MRERRGRFIVYDKQQVLKDIVAGEMSASEIANRHSITRDMVYTLKYNARRKHIIKDPAAKLDELDCVEPRERNSTLSKVYELAKDFKEEKISGSEFFNKIKILWP